MADAYGMYICICGGCKVYLEYVLENPSSNQRVDIFGPSYYEAGFLVHPQNQCPCAGKRYKHPKIELEEIVG